MHRIEYLSSLGTVLLYLYVSYATIQLSIASKRGLFSDTYVSHHAAVSLIAKSYLQLFATVSKTSSYMLSMFSRG